MFENVFLILTLC